MVDHISSFLLFADHYHLPTGLNWPKSPSVADAIERLLLEGKNVFKVGTLFTLLVDYLILFDIL